MTPTDGVKRELEVAFCGGYSVKIQEGKKSYDFVKPGKGTKMSLQEAMIFIHNRRHPERWRLKETP
jgi:hypothetical protein